ncbi:MAG: ABC-2 transporter permease [Patescibacteria group bacterium]|nr:ABC-2 transporter permease [Patescibacteria group bacterium]
MKALYFKELGYYLKNPIGYIVVVLFAVFANFLFLKDIFAIGSASMRPFFDMLPWLFMIFIPAVAMRVFAEERRSNTLETLLTLPVSETQIVLAKFFGVVTIVVLGLSLTLGIPILLTVLSGMAIQEVMVGYLGALLLASLFAAISILFSSLTKNQVVAFLSAALVLFFLVLLNSDFTSNVIPRELLNLLSPLAPVTQYDSFVKGLIDLRAVVYMLSFTALFIGLTVIDLEKRS